MRAVVIAVMLAGVWSLGFMHMPVLGQEQAKTGTDLQEARDALEAEPGNQAARRVFRSALEQAVYAAQRQGDTETGLKLADEYLAFLDLRLVGNPGDPSLRWSRYKILMTKYGLIYQEGEDAQAARDTVQAAEKDIRFLARERPSATRYKEELTRMLALKGHFAKSAPEADVLAAQAAYTEALGLAETILKDNPKSVQATFAKAYSLWWKAGYDANQKKTYEAYEAAIPLYKDTALAFKRLEELSKPNKGYTVDHAAVWYGLGQTYREIGDDEEAFKAYRLSYQLLKTASDLFPDDAALYRRTYQFGLFVSSSLKSGQEKLNWLERMQGELREAETTGRLHPDDKWSFEELDFQIELNTAYVNAATPEEKSAIIDKYFEAADD